MILEQLKSLGADLLVIIKAHEVGAPDDAAAAQMEQQTARIGSDLMELVGFTQAPEGSVSSGALKVLDACAESLRQLGVRATSVDASLADGIDDVLSTMKGLQDVFKQYEAVPDGEAAPAAVPEPAVAAAPSAVPEPTAVPAAVPELVPASGAAPVAAPAAVPEPVAAAVPEAPAASADAVTQKDLANFQVTLLASVRDMVAAQTPAVAQKSAVRRLIPTTQRPPMPEVQKAAPDADDTVLHMDMSTDPDFEKMRTMKIPGA